VTLSDIFNLAMQRLDEDKEDFPEYSDQFHNYVNMGYQIALREYYKPRKDFVFVTDDDGRVSLIDLGIIRIVSLRDGNFRPVRYVLEEDGEFIRTGEKEKELHAVCEVECKMLVNMTDVPVLPEYVHDALVDYICYQHLSSGNLGKQAKAQFYRQNFYEKMRAIRPQGTGSVTAYKNLYESTGLC